MVTEIEEKKISQSEKAYKFIKKSIMNLKYTPGQMVSENEVADELSMSRTPVREAIQRLKSEDLIETIANRGNIVKVLSNEDIRQIYEMAEGLEGMVAYLAAKNHNEKELSDLLNAVNGMEKSIEDNDFELWVENDEKFHDILQHLCGNEYLIDNLDLLYSKIHHVRILTQKMMDKKISTAEHRNIYEAIKDNNADKARTLTNKHWERVRKQILELISPGIFQNFA
jgi:DNA-binding GntR family transcriptional regulator